MPPTIKELQVALRQYIGDGLEAKEAIQRLAMQFPDARIEDTRVAAAALTEEFDLMHADAEADRRTSETMVELIGRAERESGHADMNTAEALTYLAERGDEQAQAFLDDLSGPEPQAFQREFEAAAEWHSDWTRQTQEGHYSCAPGSEVDTPEKLVAAYRRSGRGV